MKPHTFVFLTIIAIIQMCQGKPLSTGDVEKINKHCIQEVQIDKQIIDNARKEARAVDDPKYKEFLFCSYKLQGYQAENGDIIYETMKEFLRGYYPVHANSVVDNCKDIPAETPQQKAFVYLKCLLEGLKLADAEIEQSANE